MINLILLTTFNHYKPLIISIMKKILLTLAVLGGFVFSSFAQKKSDAGGSKFSIGVDAGLPVGTTSNAYSFGLGGSLKYDISMSKEAAFTLSAGYTSMMGKTITVGTTSVKVAAAGFIPVKAGIKYHFSDAFYGEGQLGAAFSSSSGGGTAFLYAPGIVVDLGGGVDLGLRYEAWSHNGTVSQIALRLAYSF